MREANESETATVWAAEHGASARDLPSDADDGGANVGHRFRIHGRLRDAARAAEGLPADADADLGADEPRDPFAPQVQPEGGDSPVTAEALRLLVARELEIDARDIAFAVEKDEVTLTGTVGDEGERRELEALLRRVPQVKTVNSQLRVHTA